MSRSKIVEDFNNFLEKATDPMQLEPNAVAVAEICRLIDEGIVQPEEAVQALHVKIVDENPHTTYFALKVLDAIFYKCGNIVHSVVVTDNYMTLLKDVIRSTEHKKIKDKILESLEDWADKFRYFPNYCAVQKLLEELKRNDCVDPSYKDEDKALKTERLQDLCDTVSTSDNILQLGESHKCYRCRTEFRFFTRKQHCTICGHIFCSQCSGKFSPIPKYGIKKEVRVCDTCYDEVNKPTVSKTKETDLPAVYLSSSLAQQQVPLRKTDKTLREEEELQMAIALSQSEAEHKEKGKRGGTNTIISNSSTFSKINYSLPSFSINKILEQLKANGCADTDCQNNDRVFKTERLQDTNGNNPSTMCQNILSGKEIKVNNNCDKTDLNTSMDLDYEERENIFKQSLREYRERKKQEYKRDRKSQGLPTSSDEEEITIKEETDASKTNRMRLKEEDCIRQKSLKLPKELDKQKRQRLQLNADAKEVRAIKHANFMKNCNNDSLELKQCEISDCKNCERYKNKTKPEENVMIPKRLPKELRQSKESKENLKESFAKYKESRKQEYYKHKSSIRSDILGDQIDKNACMKPETEDEQFQRDIERALLLSQQKNGSESVIGSDILLTGSQTMNSDEDADELQQVLDASFAEIEEKNFSPMPKFDESDDDIQIAFAKQLSLDENARAKRHLESHGDVRNKGLCLICYETRPLRRFKPCNHKCICDECTDSYFLDTCVICMNKYTSILHDM